MFALALAAAAAAPQPGTTRAFGDWAVGCDNARTCRAVALVPGGEDRDGYLLLVVERGGAGGARATLRFSTGRPIPQALATLRVDGRPVARATGEPAAIDAALASALGQGRRATLTDARGGTLASASLRGLAAAFLFMDEAQRRLGTRGALIRRGPRADASVPAPPPFPRVVQPRASAKPPRELTVPVAARLIGAKPGDCGVEPRTVRTRAVRLDAARSLALVDHPCGGAYNLATSAFVIDAAGRPTPARFDAAVGLGPDGRAGGPLVNVDWDAPRRRLSSYVKARGAGDCGVTQAFAWDGERLRLVEQAEMGECRGSVDFITTWRAAVTTAR